jgi:hypothetical protein
VRGRGASAMCQGRDRRAAGCGRRWRRNAFGLDQNERPRGRTGGTSKRDESKSETCCWQETEKKFMGHRHGVRTLVGSST